jgi:hydrogenase nickel incorporation protein HypB
MVLNKTDLLPHVDFDVARCIDYARRVNPGIEVLLRVGHAQTAWRRHGRLAPTGLLRSSTLQREAAMRDRIANAAAEVP